MDRIEELSREYFNENILELTDKYKLRYLEKTKTLNFKSPIESLFGLGFIEYLEKNIIHTNNISDFNIGYEIFIFGDKIEGTSFNKFNIFTSKSYILDISKEIGSGFCYLLINQFIVDKYKVDFLLIEQSFKLSQPLGYKKLIIECDGHDFHEKTKEQAQLDKKRQRFLQLQGYNIVRFTGSEIYRDPLECVFESMRFLQERAQYSAFKA